MGGDRYFDRRRILKAVESLGISNQTPMASDLFEEDAFLSRIFLDLLFSLLEDKSEVYSRTSI